MSFSYNRIILGGNLTRDPETRFLANEKPVVNFGIAVNERYKDKSGEMKENVTFVDVEAWGRTAELVGQYLTKGSQCLIEGRLKLDAWQDKDGQKRTKLKVVADTVQFIGGKREGAAPRTGDTAMVRPAKASVETAFGGGSVDEAPFNSAFGNW